MSPLMDQGVDLQSHNGGGLLTHQCTHHRTPYYVRSKRKLQKNSAAVESGEKFKGDAQQTQDVAATIAAEMKEMKQKWEFCSRPLAKRNTKVETFILN
jgi:hypothetical protein